MSVAGLLISLLLALIAIAIVARPLFSAATGGADAEFDDQGARASDYYERVLINIRDLDEDLATDKISEADHGREREVWVARGIALLRLQDRLAAQRAAPDEAEDIDAIIEAAVAAHRDGQSPARGESS